METGGVVAGAAAATCRDPSRSHRVPVTGPRRGEALGAAPSRALRSPRADARGRRVFHGGFDAGDLTHRLGRIEIDAAGNPITPQDSLSYVEIINMKSD
jgi:hypothetical protein